jgi:hypothetical protein
MKKFSKLVLALIAVAGIAFTAGCKSDCEKSYEDGLAKLTDDAQKKAFEGAKADFIKACEAKGADKGKEGEKKEEKKEEKK